ncbi:hypothetical protein FGW37_19465 [Streptomyces rectiverticillatus]|uniref:peroxidase family protein n=1 Tax=Streptomyces rectiverticillatus TaxID=173860 RepID=UPI0015C3CB2F|nr:peroxidase family protein [Streptomyces rectiverticillatus]QLE73474.1 hypothetical protein FGW37_19465 [Streptomyces rectiverticillatus]
MAKAEAKQKVKDTRELREEAGRRLRESLAGTPPVDGPDVSTTYVSHGMSAVTGGCPLGLGGGSGAKDQEPVTDTSAYQRIFTGDAFAADEAHLKKLACPCGPMDINPPAKAMACTSPGTEVPAGALSKTIPAGYTYFGQFLDHNITFQADATFDPGNDPAKTTNYRSARIDLSNVYGLGPQTQSFEYYDNEEAAKFWIDPDRSYDVPRNPQGVPVIADPRDDNTIITVQLHLAFMKFHNAVVDMLAGTIEDAKLFATVRQQVLWHYQWLVLHDWMPKIVKKSVYDAVVTGTGPQFFKPEKGEPLLLPIEFTAASYRLHSLVVETYGLNDKKSGHLLHFRRPFSKLRPEEAIDWSYFFDLGGSKTSNTQFAKQFDAKVVHTFLTMPGPIDTPLEWIEDSDQTEDLPVSAKDWTGKYAPLRSIAVRNLLRARAFGLPSGQTVARQVFQKYAQEGKDPYTNKELGLEDVWGTDVTEAPLWYYVLKEGRLATQGVTLGPVGSVIVGEVLYGLLKGDPNSYLNAAPTGWKPTLGKGGDFTMADLIRIAGV